MSQAIEFPAVDLVGFLRALEFTLEEDQSVVWAERTVAGERVLIAFYALGAAAPDTISKARKTLSRVGRAEPSAALNLITVAECKLTPEETQQFTDADVKVCSEAEYLSLAIRGREICQGIIRDAEQYIPEYEYIPQRISPGNIVCDMFLDEWMNSQETGLLVILGHAGFGKTCLAHHIARNLARKHLENVQRPVPFLLPLHRHRHVRRFEELVLTHLQDHEVHGFTSAAFAYLINKARVLPMLDGFDELAETGGLAAARETLRGLVSHVAPTAKVLLTSRQSYFRHQGDLSLLGSDEVVGKLQTVELEAFDQDERAAFLDRRGLTKEQVRKVQAYVRDVAAEELLASPLVLKILADDVKAGETCQANSSTEVFGLCLQSICRRELQPVLKLRFPWSIETQIGFLASIADLMHEENSYELLDCDQWLADVVLLDVPKGLAPAQHKDETDARVLQMKNHPLVRAFVSQGRNALQFPHPLYRDYFIALEFKRTLSSERQTRNCLRAGLPEASARFVGDLLTEPELVELFRRGSQWRETIRDICACALAKCDVKSKSDISVRTAVLHECIGENRKFDYENLSRLRFSLLRFNGFSFVGADFTDATFQSCEFRDCDFNGARFGGCRFYECSADETTGTILESLGVRRGTVEKRFLRAPVVPVQSEDPLLELARRFFQRFIRREPGMHQRAAALRSMFAGLGGEERKFTERELIPEMRKNGVISDAGRPGVELYAFNAEWQTDGDVLLTEGRVTPRLEKILEVLRSKSPRYNLL